MPQRFFVSYKRGGGDERQADALVLRLRDAGHEVFLDRGIAIGTEWSREIERQVGRCDIFVVLLSEGSCASDMVRAELRLAREHRERHHRPEIWPVHLEAGLRLPYEIDGYLGGLQSKRLGELDGAIAGLAEAPVPFAGEVPLPALAVLPARLSDFQGRVDQLDELEGRVRRGGTAAVCSVAGMGGIGKTQLAVELAHRLGASVFPDGILLVEMRGLDPEPVTVEAAVTEILLAIDPERRLPEGAALLALYRQQLGGRRMLLILDNARDLAQVEPLQPPAPVSFLVTSRQRILLAQQQPLMLDALAPDESLLLLRGMLVDVAAYPDAGLAALAEQCGHLPLALRAAGAFVAFHKLPLDEYLEDLTKKRVEQLSLIGEEDPRLDVRAVLASSLERLAAEDQDLLRRLHLLSIFTASFSLDAAAAVLALDSAETRQSLTRLRRLCLIEDEGGTTDKRFRLHDLMREILAERLGEAEAGEARYRHAVFFKDYLAGADNTYLEGRVAEGLLLFDRERVHIEAAQGWAAQGWAGEGWAAQASSPRATKTDKKAAELAADFPLAGIYLIQLRLHSREQIAWLESAVAAARSLGDRTREGAALGNLGLAWAALGETRKAIGLYEQALAALCEIGDRQGEGAALGNLGLAWADLGETRKAIGLYEQALAALREIGDRRGEGQALGNLGISWKNLGETRKAIGLYEQVLVIAREIGDRRGEGNALGNLGNAWSDLGETRKAIGLYEQRLVIAREIGDRRGEGNALGSLGNAWAALGETRKAIGLYEQRLVIAREIGDRRGEGNALGNLSNAYETLGDRAKAVELHCEAYVAFRDMEHPHAKLAADWLRNHGIDPDTL